jgi:hypothetical protein
LPAPVRNLHGVSSVIYSVAGVLYNVVDYICNNSVRDAARRRVPGAAALLKMLQPFFKPTRQKEEEEPTEEEVERDLKALLHGKKEGEIIVKNVKPTTSGGVHEVIDEVHKGHTAIKETVEENINN